MNTANRMISLMPEEVSLIYRHPNEFVLIWAEGLRLKFKSDRENQLREYPTKNGATIGRSTVCFITDDTGRLYKGKIYEIGTTEDDLQIDGLTAFELV